MMLLNKKDIIQKEWKEKCRKQCTKKWNIKWIILITSIH